MPRATGTFDVTLTPQASANEIGRMAIVKHFHGDLDAISHGEMLSVMTPVNGSAGYVAIERVSGTLQGLQGSFVLQHHGVMTRGSGQLSVTVVPDSGLGELGGLAGSMSIKIEGGEHSYEFDYTLGTDTI